MSDEIIPKVEEIKTPVAELQVMANLAGTTAFSILKRWVRRYTDNLRTKAFRLNPSDKDFIVKHEGYVEQAIGMEIMLRAIENAQDELDKMEGGEE